jgi:hypothetical protein
MHVDSRGGHNRKQINTRFFRTWTPHMAYVLGLIFADGTLVDSRAASRTCYFSITNNNHPLLVDIREVMSSKHNIYKVKSKTMTIRNRSYTKNPSFYLRIGSKMMFRDLQKLGLTPKKSLNMNLPTIPKKYFTFFLRGYFDGDGSVGIYKNSRGKRTRIRLTFTSGSKLFLKRLAETIQREKLSSGGNIYTYIRHNTSYLRYSKKDSLSILAYMYSSLEMAPYLIKKYLIYTKAVKT